MSCFLCCEFFKPRWQRSARVRPIEVFVKANIPIKKLGVAVLRLSSSNGECDVGTGVLIHNGLVLTSYMNLPSKKSAEDGEIVLTDGYLEPSSYSTPPLSERPSPVLRRKLLPTRCFLTNPSLGVTIVGCDPVSSHVPLDIETVKLPADSLNVGRSIYVLGHVEHDDKRKGVIMFGEGRISSEDEQVIEFYSLDGNIWAPGSAGFDDQGNFAFVVGESKSPSCAKFGVSSMRKRYLSEKDLGPKQPGILVQFIREWKRTMWDWGVDELSKKTPSSVNTALPPSTTKEMATDRSPPLDSVAKAAQELPSACRGAEGELLDCHRHGRPREDLTDTKDCARVDNNFASLGSPTQDCTASDTPEYVGPNGCSSTLGIIADLAASELQISSREDFKSRKDSARVCSNLASLSSPMQDCTASSTLGGSADLAANELTRTNLVKPEQGREEELSRTTDGDNCSGPHNDFTTGFVKVKYFNKNIFSPDRMPAMDSPNQDPNGGSWYDWGKKAQTPGLMSPKELAKGVDGHPQEERVDVLNTPQRSSPESEVLRFNIQGTPRDSGLQPLRSETFTPIPERNTSPWTKLRVHDLLGEVPRHSRPGSPRISSPRLGVVPNRPHQLSRISLPELRSPVSQVHRPSKHTRHQGVNRPPRELAFGEIHRSTRSPRSPNKVQGVQWKPPAGHGSGDPGSPLHNFKYVFGERNVKPVEFPRQGLRELGYDQKKSALAGEVRKRRERKQPGKPRWSAHSKVHKEDDNRKLAALPPRVVKLGEFPADLFSKQKERDYPKLRVKGFLASSLSWVPKTLLRNKKREQQFSMKHAREAPEPLTPKVHAQAKNSTGEKQIRSKQAPRDTVSLATEPPKARAVNDWKIVNPMIGSCKQIRSDEEILNEIERIQAVLRSPRGTLSTREVPEWGSCPEQSEIVERHGGDSELISESLVPADIIGTESYGVSLCKINKVNEIAEQKSAQQIRFTCFQYWKRFISERKDAAVESMKAVFSPRPGAHIEQHARSPLAGSPRTTTIGAVLHEEYAVPSLRWRERMDDEHDSNKYFGLSHHDPQGPLLGQTPLQENIASMFACKSPLPHREVKLDESFYNSAPGQQAVELEGRGICNGPFSYYASVESQPEAQQSHPNSPPDSRRGAQEQSRVATGEAPGFSPGFPKAYILLRPSTTNAADARTNREMPSSPRKHLSKSSAIPRKKHPIFSGPGRPLWSTTRVEGASTPTALSDDKTAMGESGKTISSQDVELEALIFDTGNEDSLTWKKSGALEVEAAKQKLASCSLPPTACPEKPHFGIRSKASPSIPSPTKRARVGNRKNPTGTKTKLLAKIFTAEIGTNVVSSCSEDGSSLSEMGDIVRSEFRFSTLGKDRFAATDQYWKWMPRWRP